MIRDLTDQMHCLGKYIFTGGGWSITSLYNANHPWTFSNDEATSVELGLKKCFALVWKQQRVKCKTEESLHGLAFTTPLILFKNVTLDWNPFI